MAASGPPAGSTPGDLSSRFGREVGRGHRSVIYEFGQDEVIKVPDPTTPLTWIPGELRNADAAARAGAPVPPKRRLVEVARRTCLVSRRIWGPTMWEFLDEQPERAAETGIRLARIQIDLLALVPPDELPLQHDMIVENIRRAARQYGSSLLRCIDLIPDRGRPMALCHGDLHPLNIIMADDGAWVVDWLVASRGDPLADVARTTVLLGSADFVPGDAVDHDAWLRTTATLRKNYLAAILEEVGIADRSWERWCLIQRVARLAEGFGVDDLDAIVRSVDDAARESRA